MRLLFAFAALLLVALWAPTATAGDTIPALVDDLLVTRWTVDDGLPLDHLNGLALADDGALWIATYDGLVRFDGRSFDTLRRANEPRLPTNRFTHIASSVDAVWARAESGELVRISSAGLEVFAGDVLPGPVSRFTSSKGTLWALSSVGPLELGGPGSLNGPWKAIFDPAPDWLAAPTGVVLTGDGSMWVTDPTGLFQVGPSPRRVLSATAADLLAVDERGDLWVGGRALHRFSPGTGGNAVSFRPVDGSAFDGICALVSRPDGTVEVRDLRGWWRVSTDGSAALVVPADVGFCDAAIQPPWPWRIAGRQVLRGDTLAHASAQPIMAILPTSDGGVWVATQGDGLARLHPRPVRAVPKPASWVKPGVDIVHLDHHRGLWVGSLGEGLARIDPPLAVVFPMSTAEGRRPMVLSMVEHGDGTLEVGTQAQVCTISPGAGRCEPSPERRLGASGSVGDVVVPLLIDPSHRGHTYFGGLGPWVRGERELYLRDREGNERWSALKLPDGTSIRHARRAAPGEDGTVYVATADQGLVVLGDGRNVRSLTTADGLSTDHLRSLYVDPRHQVWIGTEDAGLCRYRPTDGSVRCVGIDEGLPDDAVHAILPDTMNRLWLSGNRGLTWVRIEAVEQVMDGRESDVLAVTLDTRDGMPHREGNGILPNAALSDGQHLYVATQGGVAIVDPRLAPLLQPPTTRLSTINVNGLGVGPGRAVVLDHGDTLEVAWTAPLFAHVGDLRFRHRLGGERWSQPTRSRSASWASLPAGVSTIEVQAGLGGQWSTETLKLTVQRQPRFVETIWFPLAVGGTVALLGGLAVTLWLARQRNVRATLKAEVKRRTEDLSAANASLASKTAEVERQAVRLGEVNELRQRFVADLSHELRTPLSLVAGPIEDLVAGLPPEVREAQSPRLELMRSNIARLEVLADQLLDVARLEGGAIPLKVRRYALGTFLGAIVARFSPAFSKRGLSVRFEVRDEGPIVYFDGDLLDKVVTNLLANALKFTERGGVVVTVERADCRDDGFVTVRIKDSGIGIDLTRHQAIFTRFYQVDRGDARRFEGVGIGLALVRDLVALHGGEVGVESEVGAGASFWFTLPLGAAHVAVDEIDLRTPGPYDAGLIPSEVSAFESLPTQRTTGLPWVLLVEDQREMRAYLAMHLREHFTVVEAEGGEVALQIIRQAGHRKDALPSAVVSDVMMPGLDGIALTKRLKEMVPTAEIPILLVSAKAGEADRVAGLEVADDYLTKPVRPRELVARLKRLIGAGAGKAVRVSSAAGPEAATRSTDHTQPTPQPTAARRRPTSEVVLTSLFPEGVPSTPGIPPRPDEPPTSLTESPSRDPGSPPHDEPINDADPALNSEDEHVELTLTPATDPASLRLRTRLDALIDERMADEAFGVIELAAALGSSRRQLQREVRRLTGESPSDYLRRRRMERALELFVAGARDTVGEVAAAVGLSPAYFSRLYTVWHGHPPSEDLGRHR